MEFVILSVLIGLVPAAIAKQKGRSFLLWWLYGSALFVIALPHALVTRATEESIARAISSGQMRRCPHCGQPVRLSANVCPSCGRDKRQIG
jgi:hypothetical protein